MQATQAYPDMPAYEDRQKRSFEVGQTVDVGPAYRMGGSYENDGVEGTYYRITKIDGEDHLLSPAPVDPKFAPAGGVWINVTRLTPIKIEHRYWYTVDFRDTRASARGLMGWCFGTDKVAAETNARKWASRHVIQAVVDQVKTARVYLRHCMHCQCIPKTDQRW